MPGFKEGYANAKELLAKEKVSKAPEFVINELRFLNNPYYLKGVLKAIIDEIIMFRGKN